jgi:hypothetical protein
VAFGVDGDANGFAEIQVGGELQEIGIGAVADFGDLRLLCAKGIREEEEK